MSDQPAPNISADFLTGSTSIGLERIRTRLLDLTNRNKLLNFRHSNASSLRVVDASVDSVFERLRDNEKFSFLPVPQPEIERGVELPPAKDYAEKLDWNTSFELITSREEETRYLPVLHYQEQLDTISRKIASAAKTAIEESGTNMLYLIFGFLEWYESENSEQGHFAPLVVMPVTVDRSGSKGKAVETIVEYSGEDLETNLSLVEQMRRDFGLEVPLFEEDDTPDSYFAKFETILKLKKGWGIRRNITLALLSFGKLLMYRDLDPKNWPPSQSIAVHPLVKQLFEGSKNSDVTRAEEFDIDAPELMKDVPNLIRDADSSQHSALVHALRGHNLVIEGPPGTGKSQTITNLIAAALAKGKTVLFVAEKLAALEVVRRRLDDAGLGIFCLEVHSHKTKKGALLTDLAHRIQLHGTFKDPRNIDQHLSVVEDRKKLLTQYALLINKVIEPFRLTVFEILWARERHGQEVVTHREQLGKIFLPFVAEYSQQRFTETEQFLSVYARHLSTVLLAGGSISQHPWGWIAKPIAFNDEEQIISILEELVETVTSAELCCKDLLAGARIEITQTSNGLSKSASMMALLPVSGGPLVERLLVPCQSSQNRASLSNFSDKVEMYQGALKQLRTGVNQPGSLLNAKTADLLSLTAEDVRSWGLDGLSVAEIRKLRDETVETAKIVQEAQQSFQTLLAVIGCEVPPKVAASSLLLTTLSMLEALPLEVLPFRLTAFENEQTKVVLENARQESKVLKVTEATLGRDFDLSLNNGTINSHQLKADASVIDRAGILQRWFGGDYRAAAKTYRLIALTRNTDSRLKMSQGLRGVADYDRSRKQFEGNPTYRQVFGLCFRGVDSAWDLLQKTQLWYEEVFQSLPEQVPLSETFRNFLLSSRSERLRGVKANLSSSAQYRKILNDGFSRISTFISSVPSQRSLMSTASFDDCLSCLHRFNAELLDFLQAVDLATVRDDIMVRDISKILESSKRCRSASADIQASTEASALLQDLFRGAETDVGPVRDTVRFAETVASGSLPMATIQWLLCEDYEARLKEIRNHLVIARDSGEKLKSLSERLTALSGSSFWSTSFDSPSQKLRSEAQEGLKNREAFSQWTHYVRLRMQSTEIGVERLTSMAEARLLETDELCKAYRYTFYNSLARSIFTEDVELSGVAGVTQEQLQTQFAEADRESIRLYSERAAAQIDKRNIAGGNQSGPVRSWTEMALVINEINKQKRHIPIRQLILRSCNALLALKPCFMMGPLSVAQYLAPGQLKFDLVVMDEASQLKPEDAIGALARGGQVVIVGDPKQLPPTNFFQRVSMDADDESMDEVRTAVEEGESILDVASTLYQPVRRLRWHYRSRHHSLIAFSNQEFYQGDLIIFPSAYHDNPSLGVKHHFINDGVFENGRNPREAEVVVNAVLEHMRHHPNESLGIVTLNFEQRELVEELLDQRLRDDSAAIAFQERMKGGQETLFVKNLENVQGDERDVIFISTTYGPDIRGNQFQRFGPINGSSGHRRLNVLFTRAKSRTVVFTSLDPERIQTTTNSPWGLRALKAYLTYARTGILQQAEVAPDQPTNDFERAVGSILKEKGYEVVPQVGVAGFFIDLGVKHPAKPGAFLLGIECDGASYHSGRSARDRDRLRQEILVNLGWNIHRVWSTDWFKSRDSEIKRLLTTIEKLLARDRANIQQRQSVLQTESLRKELEVLRERIAKSFPNTPADRNILQETILHYFLEHRPKTREDWVRTIPQELRAAVDSRQVNENLDKILRMIAEFER
jgi:very-short-patch-repair endonuclease